MAICRSGPGCAFHLLWLLMCFVSTGASQDPLGYYSLLGVQQNAVQADIQKAYRKEAMKWHPDRNPSNKTDAEERFKKIAEAYTVLRDEKQKARYDSTGKGANDEVEPDFGDMGFPFGEGEGMQAFMDEDGNVHISFDQANNMFQEVFGDSVDDGNEFGDLGQLFEGFGHGRRKRRRGRGRGRGSRGKSRKRPTVTIKAKFNSAEEMNAEDTYGERLDAAIKNEGYTNQDVVHDQCQVNIKDRHGVVRSAIEFYGSGWNRKQKIFPVILTTICPLQAHVTPQSSTTTTTTTTRSPKGFILHAEQKLCKEGEPWRWKDETSEQCAAAAKDGAFQFFSFRSETGNCKLSKACKKTTSGIGVQIWKAKTTGHGEL